MHAAVALTAASTVPFLKRLSRGPAAVMQDVDFLRAEIYTRVDLIHYQELL